MSRSSLRIGSRGSNLALTQANLYAAELVKNQQFEKSAIEIVVIKTRGDISQAPFNFNANFLPGIFSKELEQALISKQIDLAVHSLKDLPSSMDEQFHLGGYLPRSDPRDVLCARNEHLGKKIYESIKLKDSQASYCIATSSPRRAAFIKHHLASVKVVPIRGNVETRIGKLQSENIDATLLAKAGLLRLHLFDSAWITFSTDELLPPAGQGIIVGQCLQNDLAAREMLNSINHIATDQCAQAERGFMAKLGVGCQSAVSVHAKIVNASLEIKAQIMSLDGKQCLVDFHTSDLKTPKLSGEALADKLIRLGAQQLLQATL